MEKANWLTPERVEEIDAKFETPQQRANIVHEQLMPYAGDFAALDMLYYSVGVLNALRHQLPWLNEPVKRLITLVQAAHYQAYDEQLKNEPRVEGNISKIDDKNSV